MKPSSFFLILLTMTLLLLVCMYSGPFIALRDCTEDLRVGDLGFSALGSTAPVSAFWGICSRIGLWGAGLWSTLFGVGILVALDESMAGSSILNWGVLNGPIDTNGWI